MAGRGLAADASRLRDNATPCGGHPVSDADKRHAGMAGPRNRGRPAVVLRRMHADDV